MEVPQSKRAMEDFKLITVIGKGSYGHVLLVKEIKTGEIYAMKILKKKYIEDKKQTDHVITERNILAKIKHPFIIKLAYSFQNNESLYFVMQYCHGGELFNLISKRKSFTEDQTRFYASQIVLAIEELHKNNTIYRDLKPENVLIDKYGYIKIADFGLSKTLAEFSDSRANSICGTPEYLAPEILLRTGHSYPVDWWALGSIIHEMLTGLPAFFSEDRPKLFENIKYKQLNFPDKLTKPCKDLLNKLFQKNPADRLGTKGGAQEIKDHPWFINVNWNILLKKQYKPPYVPVLKDELDTGHFDKDFTKTDINKYQHDHEYAGEDQRVYQDFTYMGSNTENGLNSQK